MRTITLALLLIAATPASGENYFFGEIGTHKSLGSNGWHGNVPIRFTIGHEWAGQRAYVRAELTHVSNIDKGPPFNGQYESYLDLAGITIGWRFK